MYFLHLIMLNQVSNRNLEWYKLNGSPYLFPHVLSVSQFFLLYHWDPSWLHISPYDQNATARWGAFFFPFNFPTDNNNWFTCTWLTTLQDHLNTIAGFSFLPVSGNQTKQQIPLPWPLPPPTMNYCYFLARKKSRF